MLWFVIISDKQKIISQDWQLRSFFSMTDTVCDRQNLFDGSSLFKPQSVASRWVWRKALARFSR
jgi:hypothetical protein